ncbi:uncharacterized protein LOC130446935 [Diorhabda sublineata]|uniref:uncharacterized protein LOC130446935 n=1 Tax=Diorhabda sublineata TaxID=1163346 RepID=UPI0024E152C3|nr:uncharacterized protein LOC130446935 [Diorhabda sublineata]
MRQFQPNIPIRSNLTLYEAIQTLDLPEMICDDLVICISNPRYQILSWYLPWMVLYRLCVMYLRDPLRTRNYITKLDYVDIDYSKFDRNQKVSFNPFEGIEEGYEKYLNSDYESENESTSETCAPLGDDYDPNSMESLKKIVNNAEVEPTDNRIIRNNGKKGLEKLKRKFRFFGKRYAEKSNF